MGKLEEKILQSFLKEKEELLEIFKKKISLTPFNYSIEELISIENKALNNIEDENFAYIYHIYIGEVLLNYIEGKWGIGHLKKDAYHKPVI